MTTSEVALPFSADARTGFELELLCPRGSSRRAFALTLAAAFGGRVRFGTKYKSEGFNEAGRPRCDLTSAYAVVVDGRTLATLVDDNTITDDLDASALALSFHIVLDDLRLALWTERNAWSDDEGIDAALAPLVKLFEGEIVVDNGFRQVLDRYGHIVAAEAIAAGERERVCEVVTAPLTRVERTPVLDVIYRCAHDSGLTVPAEAALHLHFDRAPWMSTKRLAQLIVDTDAARALLRQEWRPNPRCRRLAPFSREMVRIAQTVVDKTVVPTFSEMCAGLDLAGATKYCDVNVLGIIRPRPRHPTLEIRCLPQPNDTPETLRLVRSVEEFLLEVACAADAA